MSPLQDRLAPQGFAIGDAARWKVIVLSDAQASRLYTTMTRDVAFAVHRATCQLLDGYPQSAGIDRLVLVEPFACRHTARARMMRLRRWPATALRRLIEASNPAWRPLDPDEGGPESAKPTMPSAPSAAA